MFYTTDQLIESVKARTLAPEGQITFTDTDYIRFLNEEFQLKLVPDMIALREDYFLKSITESVVANQSAYTMPNRAIGNTLKDLFYLDSNNNRFQMSRINIKTIPITGVSNNYPYQFYVRADQLVIAPVPRQTAGVLQMWYYQRANQLVLSSECGQITQIQVDTPSSGQITYTVNADVSSYSTLDFLSGASPFQLWSTDVTPVSSNATTVVVTATDVQNSAGENLPQVGDWICLAQRAPIPMIPEDFHPLLAELCAARVVQALGHNEKLEAIVQNIAVMKNNLQNTLSNRIEQNMEPIYNPFGVVRWTGAGWGLGWQV